MEYNSNFKYDLMIGRLKEKELGDILNNKKIEVKTDLKAQKTGNVFVEYECRGKPSGIATTKADYYCFVIKDKVFIMIATKILKDKCREYLNTSRDKKGGDNNLAKGILLPINKLII